MSDLKFSFGRLQHLMRERLQVQVRGGDQGGDKAQGDGKTRRRLDLLYHLVADELHGVGVGVRG